MCTLFVVGYFPFPVVRLPPVLVGFWKVSSHPLHSLVWVTLVSLSRSSPLRCLHTLHFQNFTALLTVYHHPRSSGSKDSVLSYHQSLGMRMTSLSLCSIPVIRSSLMSSKVCVRDWWTLLIHPLIDVRNRISVSGSSSLSGRVGFTIGISSISVMISTKCDPTACIFSDSDNDSEIIFLLPFVDLGGVRRMYWQMSGNP